MMSGSQHRRAPVLALFLILSLATTGRLVQAVWFTIPTTGTKCVSEEIQANVVVLADYYVVNDEQPGTNVPVSVKVTSPYGNNLYNQENVTHGQFAFTTAEGGNYLACFWHDSHHQQATPATLSLEWRTGIAAKDWDSVARKEKIEGVELELRKLEGAVESILNNLVYLKEREAQMREVSETTNSRVAWYSLMSIGVCIGASVMQLFHLKRYFRKKRLI